ncbi:MAG TPA: DUF3999 family protein, partial [Burkholderiaceae bacterium]|nr:DUF3999 family protein [Burkholderiaceae bacterium]
MPWSDRSGRCGALLALCIAAEVFMPAANAEEPAFRFEAPIAVQRSAPFVELALTGAAYARSRAQGADGGNGPRDLRIVDAGNEPVPFAWLAPRAGQARASESLRDAVLYPLPAKPTADGSWRAPIDVVVEGERIHVRRLSARGTSGDAARSGGWLIDLGERQPAKPAPDQLRLAWSGPSEFSAAFDIATSDDLRSWRGGGAGQVLALQSAGGALTQPNVPLRADGGRFVRLVWADAATAPALTGAKVVTTQRDT